MHQRSTSGSNRDTICHGFLRCLAFPVAGADVIACIATNDPFVMGAWGQVQNTGDKKQTASSINNWLLAYP
eukprot:925504-Pelagomonas_calceolata.AAC.3